MTRILLPLLLFLSACVSTQAADLRVVVVRHAEKATDDPRDPSLSAAGRQRAQALAHLLRDEPLAAIYSTQYRRTQLTAAPTAYAAKVRVRVRPAGESADSLAAHIRREHAQGTVVVVGHSNTVPAIVGALGGQAVAPIADDEFDHYYIVSLPADGPARLEDGRYPVAAATLPAAAKP